MTDLVPVTSLEALAEAEETLLAYGNGWHAPNCSGNFHMEASCDCGLGQAIALLVHAAQQAVTPPWREALSEAWAIIDFLAPEDEPIFAAFRQGVERVVKAREAARAILAAESARPDFPPIELDGDPELNGDPDPEWHLDPATFKFPRAKTRPEPESSS